MKNLKAIRLDYATFPCECGGTFVAIHLQNGGGYYQCNKCGKRK